MININNGSLIDAKGELTKIFTNLFSVNGNGFIKRESKSKIDLETCNGSAIDDEESNTCALCIALNNTVFHNTNKPNYYHLKCRCVNTKTKVENFEVIMSMEKITNYLFKNENKLKMMKSMGYSINDSSEIYNLIIAKIKKKFLSNDYILKELNIHGQHIQINYVLKGKSKHANKEFFVHTGLVVWPNGKLRVATPLIKD